MFDFLQVSTLNNGSKSQLIDFVAFCWNHSRLGINVINSTAQNNAVNTCDNLTQMSNL
jgi:hypothetical protein